MNFRLPVLAQPLLVCSILPQGVNVPLLVQDREKRLWVRKDVEPGGLSLEGLRAEMLGWMLGRLAGVPIPDAALWRGPRAELAWLSAFVDNALSWSAREAPLYDQEDLGAILALDAVLLNRDRNPGNLLIEIGEGPKLRVWAIDHERLGVAELAFLRQHQAAALHELPRFHPSLAQPPGLPLAELRNIALNAAARFAALPENAVAEAMQEPLGLSGYAGGDASEWTARVYQRCQQAIPLLTRYLDAQGA